MQPASATDGDIQTFRWVGNEEAFLDAPDVATCGHVVIGRYGGRTRAGASKNEDGALVWCHTGGLWELATLLDAHFTAESATLVSEAIEGEREGLISLLAEPVERAFPLLHAFFVGLFGAPDFRARCREVEGEASCLIAVRKGSYLWWLSVGDCVGYIF
ncbi:MAG TPA: protein phosphatase 2C domain-containing protein, partial [Ktedonobacterales bacterium]|nr:protein phosphatase 2C domain-containing protein [Ktedonobacterales bacterium]